MKRNILLIGLLMILSLYTFAQEKDYAQQLVQHRQQTAEAFANNPYGPIRKDQLTYLKYFDPNPAYRVTAEVEPLYNEPSFRMPTMDGTSNPYRRFALLHFEIQGKRLTLTAYQSAAMFPNPQLQDHLFLPFTDRTNGEQTYEAGRYLDLNSTNIQNGKITIDFNYAYNPYCAYSNGYRCPQPAKENHLDLRVEAGEQKYLGPKNERPVNQQSAKNFSPNEQKIIQAANEHTIFHVYQTTNDQELAVLRTASEDLRFDDPLIDLFAKRMLRTVQDPEHKGVGIAAPQVGINKNAIWVQRLDKTGEPFEFYINPKILWRSKLIRQGAEGCLSIPDLREDVQRSYAIRLQYIDPKGTLKEELIEGFTAVIFQHEVDHLYGILFPDRLEEQAKKERIQIVEKPLFFMEKGDMP